MVTKRLPPDQLYKYRNLVGDNRRFLESVFRDCTVYFASPADFNDPFDCKVHLTFPTRPQPFRKYLEGLFGRYRQDLTRRERRDWVASIVKSKRPHRNRLIQEALISHVQGEVNTNGVFCLCERPDDVLMWSHYAYGHTGVCLQFETTTDLGVPLDVEYPPSRPPVDLLHDPPFRQVEVNLLMKAGGWAYEREWRIIDTEHGFGPRQFPPDLLSAVIFGCRISAADRETIRAWVAAGPTRPSFYEATIEGGTYGLKIVPAAS